MRKSLLAWAAVSASLFFLPCAHGATTAPTEAARIQLHKVRIPNNPDYRRNAGFVDMVGPVFLPEDKKHGEHIAVWVRVPRHGIIRVRWLKHQKRWTIQFPPGTIADRVDSDRDAHEANHRSIDVRGARIGADGRTWFHDYETYPGEPKKWLEGYEWLRMDPPGDNRAADSLIKLFHHGTPVRTSTGMTGFRALNQCGACHQRNRPGRMHLGAGGVTHEDSRDHIFFAHLKKMSFEQVAQHFIHEKLPMTDDDGFYQPILVMTDRMAVLHDRPWDLNADDPYITVRCGTIKTKAITKGDKRYYRCADGRVPIGTLDMVAALKHHDPHAMKVCSARAYLYAHMDATGRKAYARDMAECRLR